jgi:hypothetical protein
MARTATRHEIASFGHIAAALRAWMKANKVTMPDFNERLGKDRGDAMAFKWINGFGAPGPTNRALVAKITGIPEAGLLPRRPGDPVPAIPPPAELVQRTASGAVWVAPKRSAAAEVLSFSAATDGMARVRLDVTLPMDDASALFRLLLDMGNILSKQEEGT